MKIAICDDEQILVKKLYDYVKQHDCNIECFLSPLELLDKYRNGGSFDAIFLDIKMEPMDGIALAREIRNYDKHAVLVFLTAYPEYAPSGYEVRAFRYLLKPIDKAAISKVMREIRQELLEHRKILIRTAECEFLLQEEDIHYIEANNKDCTIYYEMDTIILRKGLNDLEELFSAEHFFRIHRKYLVNLTHIREFDETHLTLDCGKTLPISRRKSQNFRTALEAYIEGGLHQ